MKCLLRDQTGVAIIIVAILIAVFIGFVALAVDIGHLFVVDNQLKNAADAGALAGAQVLYKNSGTEVNLDANQVAYEVALKNKSEKTAVDVHWKSGQNDGSDIERGHWSFGLSPDLPRGFYPNPSLAPVSLPDNNTVDLDKNRNFINAVRVKARREDSPAASFFATIFGHSSFTRSAEAVAYLGFAGSLLPGEVDWPIAICRQSIISADDKLTCGVGRMINSGTTEDHETGGWTNFTQDTPLTVCDHVDTGDMRDLILGKCGGSLNPHEIFFGLGIGTTGGMVDDIFKDMIECWQGRGGLTPDWKSCVVPDHPWRLKLPVILCPGNNVQSCDEKWPVDGAVKVDVVWINREHKNKYDCVPKKMFNPNPSTLHPEGEHMWECSTPSDNKACWDEFVADFNLQIVVGKITKPAPFENKTIYFLPTCEKIDIGGITGGHNYGILAEIPVLVK